MTKRRFVSLAQRFATQAALLAGLAMLVIAGASWWLINQEHAAAVSSLLKKDAELQATSVSSDLREIAGRMSELAKSSLIANALLDSSGKERYLVPFLRGIQRIHNIPVDIVFADFVGREITGNGNGSFSSQELNWLRERLAAGQAAARVQRGEKGEELLAVEFIVLSGMHSVEGALLYKIKLADLSLQDGVRLVHGTAAEQRLHGPAAMAAALNMPPIYQPLGFAVVINPERTARPVNWQSLGLFFILAAGMVVSVIMLGLHFGKRLTRDLAALDFFARDVAEKGFDSGRAEAADSLEVASLAQSINRMLDRLKQQHDRLHESESMSRSLTESMAEGVVTTTTENIVLEANAAALQLFGYEKSELIGRDVTELVPERHRRQFKDATAQWVAQPEAFKIPGLELRCLHQDGSEFSACMSFADVQVGGQRLITGVVLDITERILAQSKIKRLNRIYAVLSGITTTIVRVSDRQELFVEACRIAVEHGQFKTAWIGLLEPNAADITPAAWAGIEEGYLDQIRLTTRHDESGSCPWLARALLEKTHVVCNDIAADPLMARWRDTALQRGYRSLAVLPLLLDDKAVGLLVLYASETGFFDTAEMKLLVELVADVSFALDYIEKRDRLNYLAYYDVVTGLPNRSLFHDRLNQHLLAARENDSMVALLGVDLEQFRVINETLGRQVGDALLKQVAERLRGAGLDGNNLAHTGAGCFAVVLDNLQNEADVAHILERRINDSLRLPFVVAGTELRISAKAGIALFPTDGADADSLLRNAAAALEKAKLAGDKYLFYTPEINARVAENLTLENKLRQALEKEEFVLHYQPKVDLENRLIVGVEALIRWQSPELGLVPPLKFIPLLEQTGLILEVGAWALRRAVADHRHWIEMGLAAPRIAVNMSMVQLRQREFVDVLRAVIGDDGRASGIDLEITESLIMDNVQDNITKLQTIRDMGIAIAIDDFGTGYSSLAYLAKLPVQTLKIDRAFIITMLKDPNAMLLVQTMISLAHSLGLKVVGEGVDEEEQATALRLLKCDEMQGYLFSRAVPAAQIEQFLREKKAL